MAENIVNDEKKGLSSKAKGVIAGSVAAGLTAVVAAVTIVSLTKPDLPNQQQSYSVKISSEFEGFKNSNLTIKGGTKVEELKTMIASPVEGYKVEGLYQDLACTKPYSPETVITENMQVFVKFDLEEYTVTAYADTSKTQVLETVTVKYGKDATLTAPTKADDKVGKHEFVGWTDAMGNPVQLTNIKADTEVFANFVVTEYIEYAVGELPSQVAVTKGSGETETTVATGDNLHYGDRVKIVYTPSTGHQMKTFAVSGAEAVDGAENWYEITGALVVSYSEEKIAYVVGELPKQVTILDAENNKVESGATLLYDDIITITYTPTAGYVMTEFEVAGAYPVEGLGAGENKYNVRGNITVTYAEEESQDIEYLNYEEYEDGYMVSGLNDNTIEDVIIPATYQGKKVYGIKDGRVFNYRKQGPFSECMNLKSVTIKEGVESIGNYAFYFCNNLKSITIPSSVKTIGEEVFYNCRRLISITIPSSVTSIGYKAFNECVKLIEVYNLSPLNITAGSSANGWVGYYAKNVYTATEGSSKLKNVNGYIMYEDNENSEYYLVDYTGSKTTLVLPTTTYNYGIYKNAFDGCISLTSIAISEGVTSIGAAAFNLCTGLTSITIPSSVTSIDDYVFRGCSGLTSIIVDGNNSVYTSRDGRGNEVNCLINKNTGLLINGCKNSTIPDDGSVTSIGNCAFTFCTGLTSITIPEGVTSIGAAAFDLCTGLTSITIPSSVTSIGSNAFWGCTGLTEINYNAKNVSDLKNSSNIFYNAGTSGDGVTVTFGEGVESIPAYLFYVGSLNYRPKITSITISSTVTSIGNYAFYNCTNLTTVIIESANIYTAATGTSSSNAGALLANATTVKVLANADDGTNTFLGDATKYDKTTETVDEKTYNVYTKK